MLIAWCRVATIAGFRQSGVLSTRPTILFLSPHLDDVVFSCPGRVLAEARSGARVVVATVFSHCGRDSANAANYRERREEDRASVRMLGAEPLWLGLPDAPFRHGYYDSFRTIIFGEAPAESEWMPRIIETINKLLESLCPDRVYVPLGVGHHIDHRLTFRAIVNRQWRGEICYYEERPYCFVPHAVQWRMNGLNGESREARMDAPYWRALLRARYVRTYLPVGNERRLCREAMEALPQESPATKQMWTDWVHPVDGEDLELIRRAIFGYRSQTDVFLGSDEDLKRNAGRHARSLGAQSGWVERIWSRD